MLYLKSIDVTSARASSDSSPPSHRKQFRAVADTMRKTLLAHAREAHEAAKALELSESEKQIIDLITKIRDLRSTFKEYSSNSTLKHFFEVQITSLQTIFTAFVSVQSAALQNVLDLVSCNVGGVLQHSAP